MTLPSSGFSLTDVNTELGVSGYSLVSCISRAGKTGVWNSLLDFANYSYGSISVNPTSLSFLGFDIGKNVTVTSSGTWTALISDSWITANPTSGSSGTTVLVRCLKYLSGPTRYGSITFRLGSNPLITATLSISQTSDGLEPI